MGFLRHVHILLPINPWTLLLVVWLTCFDRSLLLLIMTHHYIFLNLPLRLDGRKCNHRPLSVWVVRVYALIFGFCEFFSYELCWATNSLLSKLLLLFLLNKAVGFAMLSCVVLRKINFLNSLHHQSWVFSCGQANIGLLHLQFVEKGWVFIVFNWFVFTFWKLRLWSFLIFIFK